MRPTLPGQRPFPRLSTLAAALAGASGLLAATPAAAQPAAAAPGTAASAPARATADSQTVVVTATRRAERLQDVPLVVTAISASSLADAGVKDLNSLQYVAPGLQVGDTPSDKGFRVRGVGSLTGTYVSGQELPVGVVIDGVVQGLGAGISNLAEVERVEILKGPQGTQFGKNSAAGLVSITTARPELKQRSGMVSASAGTGGEYELRMAANLPLGEHAALRLSAFGKGHDDFVNNIRTGSLQGADKQSGARLRLLLQPSRGLELLVSADASTQAINSGSQLWTVNRSPVALPGITYGLGNFSTAERRPGAHRYERAGLSLEANLQWAGHTLTSVTAHRRLRETDAGGFGQGFDFVPFPPFTLPGTAWYNEFNWDKRQTTQELRITSPKGQALEYVAGYLYYDQPTDSRSTGGVLRPGGWIFNAQNGLTLVNTTTTSQALFADGKWRLSPTVALLFGLRHTQDKVRAQFANRAFDGGAAGPAHAYTPAVALPDAGKAVQSRRSTGKLGTEWRLDADTLLFGTVSTGYLGPIVNFGWSSGVADVLTPQTNTNLTLGLKSQFLQRRLTLNLSVFQDKYKNFQTGYFSPAPEVQFRAENAATMDLKGLEAELSARLDNGLSAQLSLAYVHSAFGNFCSGGAATPIALAVVPPCTSALGFAGGQLRGYTPPGVPKLTAGLGLTYGTELPGGHFLNSTLGYYHRDKTRNAPADPFTETPAYGLTNVNFSLSPADGRWTAGLHVRNLFNKRFASAVMNTSFAPEGTYVNWVTREARRQLGVTVDYRF